MPKKNLLTHQFMSALKSFSHWKSVLVIVSVGSIGIAASQALFRDIEQSQKGVFVVGTLDLNVDDDSGGTVPQSIQIDKVGQTKSVSGEKTYNLHNDGSLDGEVHFRLANLVNYENGCNEPESLVDTTCDNPGPDQGELGENLVLEVVVGSGNDAYVAATGDLATANMSQFESQWESLSPPVELKAGKTLPITLRWHSKEGGLDNRVQSDSVAFDLVYELRQIINQ